MPDPNNIITINNPPYQGAIRDLTIAPDASGVPHLWGGPATNVLYKFDAGMNTIATFYNLRCRFQSYCMGSCKRRILEW
jgi:hypothetical protein